ncbi:MAG: hypothetical protein Q4D19_06525 [Lautropia sp.]|nr:hypothetical protein [Lautropia sp.]
MATSILNRVPRVSGDQSSWFPLLLGALFLFAGAVVGLVVATGNLILIALVLGGIGGLLLLNALPAAVWLLLIGVFLINGPIGYFWPSLAKVSWLFSLLGIFMSGAALLYAVAGTKRFERPMPAFIYFSLVFIFLALVSAVISDGGLNEVASGAKRYFHFWGVMFLLAVIPFSEKQVRNWLLFLLGAGLVQLPMTLYQYVVLMPGVMGYDKPGFVPFDIIVGSFEGSITGGGASSILAMFLVLMALAVFISWREKVLNGLVALVLIALLLTPLGLGETKIVIIIMPVVLFAAYFDLVGKRPLAFLGIVIITLIAGAVLGYLYFTVQVAGDMANMAPDEIIRDTFEYNFGSRGYYATGVNRLTAVPYWFESQSWNNPLKTLFGTGLGSSYGVDGLVPEPGHMFSLHRGMHIDLLTTSTVLWDVGIVGAIVYFAIFFGAMVNVAKCLREATTGFDRMLCRVLMAGLAVTLVMSMYTNSAVLLVSHGFIVSFILGMIAWRYRHGPLSPTAADLRRSQKSRMAGGGTKVIFPTDGLWSNTIIGRYREQRQLGHSGAGVASGRGQDAQARPALPAASLTRRNRQAGADEPPAGQPQPVADAGQGGAAQPVAGAAVETGAANEGHAVAPVKSGSVAGQAGASQGSMRQAAPGSAGAGGDAPAAASAAQPVASPVSGAAVSEAGQPATPAPASVDPFAATAAAGRTARSAFPQGAFPQAGKPFATAPAVAAAQGASPVADGGRPSVASADQPAQAQATPAAIAPFASTAEAGRTARSAFPQGQVLPSTPAVVGSSEPSAAPASAAPLGAEQAVDTASPARDVAAQNSWTPPGKADAQSLSAAGANASPAFPAGQPLKSVSAFPQAAGPGVSRVPSAPATPVSAPLAGGASGGADSAARQAEGHASVSPAPVQQGGKREPVIDINGPETRPMFADDEDPRNGALPPRAENRKGPGRA